MIDEKNTNDVRAQEMVINQFEAARKKRSLWESHWQECYDYALPQRQDTSIGTQGGKRNQQIFDATALNAVDQLAASLLSELTPPWSRWFNLTVGPDVPEQDREIVGDLLEEATGVLQNHFDRSNFAVEMHQAFLDVVTAGTASILFEEAKTGDFSAFQFKAIPLEQLYVLESDDGTLNVTFRHLALTSGQMKKRFGDAVTLDETHTTQEENFKILEAVLPVDTGYEYFVINLSDQQPAIIETGFFRETPFVTFRWSKSPGEIYGRSPVMKALPDIKTANKVVELILKNASIAVTGIWQADDDGVLNPANIKLVPGTIIPKAVGSAGLKPLEMPGKFDVSQLVLDDLRGRIQEALLADKLSAVDQKQMTATEVLERASTIARLLGATYGRLQSELLTPLIKRAYAILRRRGEIADLPLDGRYVTLRYTSPLAKAQAQRDMQLVLSWIEKSMTLGDAATAIVNVEKAARYIGETLGVPNTLIRNQEDVISNMITKGEGDDV